MAGGVGSRFWPRSTRTNPKQLLKIFGENTMIQDTVSRLKGLVSNENIFIITNKLQSMKIKEQLPQLPEENVVAEPFGKNTAPCIGLASVLIKRRDPDSVMVILPADHLIKDDEEFRNTIISAADFANRSGGLVTFGIMPDRPETGYGYIQFKEELVEDNVHEVNTFAEKPNLDTAKRFVSSGDFLWNSGMFIWRTDVILKAISDFMPELYRGLLQIEQACDTDAYEETLSTVYGRLTKISIDYGIMEKANNVFVIPCDFGWSDVGGWETVYQLSPKDEFGNVASGDVYLYDTKNSYVYSERDFTAVIGIEDAIIINNNNTLLVCKRENSQDVKQVVDYLKMNGKKELL
jgi:mannose-1-phosphate guanylyltransferase